MTKNTICNGGQVGELDKASPGGRVTWGPEFDSPSEQNCSYAQLHLID
jgi:hypothetical protein